MAEQEKKKSGFDPNEHLMQLKTGSKKKLDVKGKPVPGWDGKDTYEDTFSDYLPVQWRLVWFRSTYPHGTIETELIHLDLAAEFEEEKQEWVNGKRQKVIKKAKGIAVSKATVTDGEGGIATGTKAEKAVSFADFIEKSETGSIGRALAALGYGTQFAPELDEGERIVDSPLIEQENREEKKQSVSTTSQSSTPQPTKITLTKEKRKEYLDEILLFCMHIKDEDFIAFRQLCGIQHADKWTDQEQETAHQKLAQYAVPETMKEKYNSYTERLTAPAMQRFAKRVLKKSLADSLALDVARSIELLDKAAFLAGLAKLLDPEYTEIKRLGAKPEYMSKTISVDHVLDCFGHPKEDDLLREYKRFLRARALASPEKLEAFPADLKERHSDSWKRLLAPKEEQIAS